MRTAGATYQKLREVKHRHLIELYKKFLRRSPALCKYNRAIKVQTEEGPVREVRLCMLHQPETGTESKLLDICEQTGQCEECNAFISLNTKESIKAVFEEELKNSNIKARKYPDICALEWVLGQSSVGTPSLTRLKALWIEIKTALKI